ncbi:MAG: hypothetical protein AAGE96_21440 [Cyanobacteria bacterium P01_G01_bin.19]
MTIADGEYYMGVSSLTNFEYNTILSTSNFGNDRGISTGNYDLNYSD